MSKKKIEFRSDAEEMTLFDTAETPVIEPNIDEIEVEAEVPAVEKVRAICAVNVRLAPSKEAPVLYILNKDEEVEIVGEHEEWYRINDAAYVMKEFVEKV